MLGGLNTLEQGSAYRFRPGESATKALPSSLEPSVAWSCSKGRTAAVVWLMYIFHVLNQFVNASSFDASATP